MTKDKYNLFRRKVLKEVPQGVGPLPGLVKKRKVLAPAPLEMNMCMNLGERCDVSLPRCAEKARANPPRANPPRANPPPTYRPRKAACPAPPVTKQESFLFPPRTTAVSTPASNFFNATSSLFPGVKSVAPRSVLKEVAAPASADAGPPPPPGSRAARLRDFVATYF
jgi:hypothetical protein